MDLLTSYETSDYITDIVVWLIILKLLRFDIASKYFLIIIISLIVVIGSVLMPYSILMFPFMFFKLDNEVLGGITKILMPIIIISLGWIYRNQIISLAWQFRDELKNESNKLGLNFSKDLKRNSNLNDLLNKYFNTIKEDIDNHIFYVIPVFGFLLYLIYSMYNYPYQIHLPLFGFFNGIENFLYFSKWNLIWILPVSLALTFVYAKYYLTLVLNPIYEKFHALCMIASNNDQSVVMNKNFNLKIIDKNMIDDHFHVSESLNFIESNGELFFIFDSDLNCRKFKSAYISIRINGYIYFKKEFYEDFS